MGKRRFAQEALSDWMRSDGPDSEIVISSRIRIARNLRKQPFPMLATNQQSREVMEQLTAVAQSEELKEVGHFDTFILSDLSELEKRVLVEKHLISRTWRANRAAVP